MIHTTNYIKHTWNITKQMSSLNRKNPIEQKLRLAIKRRAEIMEQFKAAQKK